MASTGFTLKAMVAAALVLGASGIAMGTRFIATRESKVVTLVLMSDNKRKVKRKHGNCKWFEEWQKRDHEGTCNWEGPVPICLDLSDYEWGSYVYGNKDASDCPCWKTIEDAGINGNLAMPIKNRLHAQSVKAPIGIRLENNQQLLNLIVNCRVVKPKARQQPAAGLKGGING